MPIYKQDSSGKFVPFEETPFPDLERVLEDWIEGNPHMLLEGENIAIFARQPRTGFDKYLDLLGIDKTGATVIIELKRGETPRDVVAQTLEYAAWVDSLTLDQLDEMARHYAERHNGSVEGLAHLYGLAFRDELEEEEEEEIRRAVENVTFNNRQRLVIVAERISDEVEQTIRYLRTRNGLDVYGVEFSVHKAGEDLIVTTTTVVGRERASKLAQPTQKQERESDESIVTRVKTDFMRKAVTAIETWVSSQRNDGLLVDHSSTSEHYLRYLGATWLYYYYANSWMYMSLTFVNDGEVERLRSRLSKPDSLLTKEHWNGSWRFHVAADGDLEALKDLILERMKAT